jgi:hypothetical protein
LAKGLGNKKRPEQILFKNFPSNSAWEKPTQPKEERMKNAIQTNSHRNPQPMLGYFTPLLLLLLALLMAQPLFAQGIVTKRPGEPAIPMLKADRTLEKILTTDMKKYLSELSGLRKEGEQIRNDNSITNAKRQALMENLTEKAKKFDVEWQYKVIEWHTKVKDIEPVLLSGVKLFDFNSEGIMAHSDIYSSDAGLYLLGEYAGYSIYANILATKEFIQNADKGLYDIEGVITTFVPMGGMKFGMIIEQKSFKKSSSNIFQKKLF